MLKLVTALCIAATASAAAPTWETKWFTQELDHFDFSNTKTFQQRYLVNTDHWKPGGPIFFYTGNEGNITLFAENTGELDKEALPGAVHLHSSPFPHTQALCGH